MLQLVIRPDDREEVVKARFKAFAESTAPLLDFYEAQRVLHRIPSPTSKQGYVRLQEVLNKLGFCGDKRTF
jgi:adenylate kinase family enzyme